MDFRMSFSRFFRIVSVCLLCFVSCCLTLSSCSWSEAVVWASNCSNRLMEYVLRQRVRAMAMMGRERIIYCNGYRRRSLS